MSTAVLGRIAPSGRSAAVRHWVRQRLGTIHHEQRVARAVMGLCDALANLHDLDPAERRLLRWAALLHDVGRHNGSAEHHIAGADLIQKNSALPLRAAERRALGYLTRYHRGPLPDAQHDRILSSADDRDRLRLMLGLLRAADTLDSRRLAAPAIVMRLEGRRLHIRCYVPQAARRARRTFERRKRFRLLEETLRLRVKVEVRRA